MLVPSLSMYECRNEIISSLDTVIDFFNALLKLIEVQLFTKQAYQAAVQLLEHRDEHQSLRIPIVVIPGTISNNVPGTEFSLGCDTALNEITEICDRIRQSAQVRDVLLIN